MVGEEFVELLKAAEFDVSIVGSLSDFVWSGKRLATNWVVWRCNSCGRKIFRTSPDPTSCTLFLLQNEACALQDAVQTRADTELELKFLKELWSMNVRTLRTLATSNSMACRQKTKQLRETLEAHVKLTRKRAKIPTVIRSYTFKELPLEGVLKRVKCRRMAFTRWLSDAAPRNYRKVVKVHNEACKLLNEITVHVKDVLKISRNKEEIIGLKKAVNEALIYLKSNPSLVSYWLSKVTPVWDVMRLHLPQECSEVKNRDEPSTVNCLDTSNDGSKTQAGTFTVGTDVVSCTSNQLIGINNNLMHKEMNSTNSNSKSFILLHGNCSKCMSSMYTTDKTEQLRCNCSVVRVSRKYRPYARKGTQGPYVLKGGKENHLYSSVTCERDNGNEITTVSTADSALEGAGSDSMSIDSDVAAIVRDMNVVSPVSPIRSLDDSFFDSSYMIENMPIEVDCSVMLQGGRTEVQEEADINRCNKDSAQFTSDATGTLTPSATCPKTKEIYNIDGIVKEHKTVSPINSYDDFFREISDIIDNIPSFELGYSKTLEDVGTEIQKAADINDHNKDSTQFTSTATGTLTPSAAHEDGPSVTHPRTKEIYDIDGTVFPISILDDSFYEMSDIENIPSFELDYSFLL